MLARSVRRVVGSRNRNVQERAPADVTRNSKPTQRMSAHSARPEEGAGVDLQKVSVRALRISRCAPIVALAPRKAFGGATGAQNGKTSWDRVASTGTEIAAQMAAFSILVRPGESRQALEHQTTNLGAGGSNPSGRATIYLR